jgi:hypothetical protein
MKDNLHEVDKTQRTDGFWIWLCSDDEGKEWATYLSQEADAEATLHGHYFTRENLARKDFQDRQELSWTTSRQQRLDEVEDLQLLDTDYADLIANSPQPNVEMNLRQWGAEAEEARIQTQWLTVLSREPKTPEEEEKWMETWEEVTGRTISEQEFLTLSRLLWNH